MPQKGYWLLTPFRSLKSLPYQDFIGQSCMEKRKTNHDLTAFEYKTLDLG
jgi:hypothetical protein